MTDNDRFDELMRRALAEEADRVEPTDSLHEIQSRVSSQRKVATRRPWVITAGAAVVGAAAAIGAFTMLGNDTRPTGEPEVAGPPATSSTTPRLATPAPSQATQAPSAMPTDLTTAAKRGTLEPKVKSTAVSVYWVGKETGNLTTSPTEDAGVRLYRTFVPISGRPALEAVRMLGTGKTDDPDYYSLWTKSVPLSVTRADDVVTVDFRQIPQQKMSAPMANIAVQQLVYTIQGVFGDDSQQVRVTEQGRSAGMLFGQVDSRQPFSRAQAADVQAKVWITSPVEGELVKAAFPVQGVAATFEASVNWRATNTKTGRTVQGHTMTKQGQGFAPYTYTLKLEPGYWKIETYLISPQDGRITDTDSKSVIVR
jgi:hypothetical protein